MKTDKKKFDEIIDSYRENSFSERDKGTRFEKLMKSYLKTKSEYKQTLNDVWLWNEFPYKAQFGGKDTGIDIVCKTFDNEYWAVQCKCYAESSIINKPAVDTFLSTSSKLFETSDGEKSFAHRLWIDTTRNGFNAEAENTMQNQNPPVSKIGLYDLRNDSVDWEKLNKGLFGKSAEKEKYTLLPHQQKAHDNALEYLKTHERGKLIMACGTGKTFTSLRIAEDIEKESSIVLFLVPSIALLSQTLKEWTAQATQNLFPICICSDKDVSKASDDFTDSLTTLALPASTNIENIKRQFKEYQKRQKENGGIIVVFSTYQSIDVVSKAQKEFDLIIADEAHRTTGFTQEKKADSVFVKVHDNSFIKARKRIYMTATPRLFSDETKRKADEKNIYLCSMDNEDLYGKEMYRIGFGEAVEKQLLSDYKVIVLTLNENSIDNIDSSLQKHIAQSEIKADDALKLIGCINVLSKRTSYLTDKELFSDVDPEPMRSAVAFCSNIKTSKYIKESFDVCKEAYYKTLTEKERESIVSISAEHIDGTMGSGIREEKLEWLKNANAEKNECRILNNVRCLSEGVDVPSLDAIFFLSSRNSEVDVVQSVGRVMRKAEGKKFGYIIIPVVIPANADASEILDKSDDFKIVWSVLNALRAHDDRFNATINKIELNKKKPSIIKVVGGKVSAESAVNGENRENVTPIDDLQQKLFEEFEKLQAVVYAKMVEKCGDRRYWEDWGKDVGEIAKRNIERIKALIKEDGEHKKKFREYLDGLRKNINPSVTETDAIEMLSQHIVTKPVFEALFGSNQFTSQNPVSKSLDGIVQLLDEKTDKDDIEKLSRFYESVKKRVENIDNAEGKQKIVVKLYDSFFRNAFPLTVEKLGIVYTPVEVVDFIIHSVEWVLNTQFNRSLTDKNVNVIDPFTGTGTFITRLLQSGIIKAEDMERKYKSEIFANEIVLLAYYIASVNIENVYNTNREKYEAFKGICLTDTFQLYEYEKTLDDSVFAENSERVNEQRAKPITVIMGNPPYSVGQKSANDNAQNQSYPKLERRIASTYVALSEANLNKATYDSYIKTFRWATERLNSMENGIVAFVSNGSWLDNNGLDGFRKTIEKEFSKIYVFNLRGNQRTSGELSKKEGGKIFGSGSRTPISITILVKSKE